MLAEHCSEMSPFLKGCGVLVPRWLHLIKPQWGQILYSAMRLSLVTELCSASRS